MKQLLDKIEEGRKSIELGRAKETFDLRDLPKIENWERRVKTAGTPVSKFYDSWVKVHQAQKLKLITRNDEAADVKLPALKKSKRARRERDSDEDSELEIPVEEMERRLAKQKEAKKTKKAKKVKSPTEEEDELPRDAADIVEDIKGDDWD